VKKLIKEQVKQNNAVYGSGWSGPIFQSAEGTLLREYTVNREIRRICKAAEMEYFTCHAFRITFATRFIEQRPQDFKILSEIMGHKDISITMNLYTRVMQDSKIAAMKGIKIKTS
jgi:integrase